MYRFFWASSVADRLRVSVADLEYVLRDLKEQGVEVLLVAPRRLERIETPTCADGSFWKATDFTIVALP